MTIYYFNDNEIRNESKAHMVGWFNDQIHNRFDCLLATRNILEKHGHNLKVKLYIGSIKEYVQVEPVIREVEKGYYITDLFDDINYAYISKDMACGVSCIKAVMKVIST